ncbi:MAG TPA: SMI1/KNR4 family protein [Ktedonobacteraceae bacterium]|nr:SMI1/KNR4 family protein [Ktedonobacteraceae bacterium]
MSLQDLLIRISNTPDCEIFPATGLPKIQPQHTLPEDVRNFYTLCGGVKLYETQSKRIRILPPERVELANPILMRGLTSEQYATSAEDISWSWYLIAEDYGGNYVTIDFSQERLGRCYDSFFDRHAMPGYCPVIASSFTEFLTRLFENQEEYPYWNLPSFSALGDAYDGIHYKR